MSKTSIPASAEAVDHKARRQGDFNEIIKSAHLRKIVVAGPGTGKSFLFTEVIKKRRKDGKTRFLAITFIGKLGDALADDLCGLATTTTMHGFARGFVLEHLKNWIYYPRMEEIIREDLLGEGIKESKVGDENYVKRTKHYRAIGDGDVVHYAVEICRKDEGKIPLFDLILVDEYQDFNAKESELIDLLAKKNEIIIVGDDDQALYAFKGSSPAFIREKYHPDNTEYESHTLRYCSRCTEVIIKYFHRLVDSFNLNASENGRIRKQYICYSPEKAEHSVANPKVHLLKQCPTGMIAYKIQEELKNLCQEQKIKDVLVIGEGRSCVALLKQIAQQLKNRGFKNVDYRGVPELLPLHQSNVDAYRILAKDPESTLAWRILGNPTDATVKKQHLRNSRTMKVLAGGMLSERASLKLDNITALEAEIEDWKAVQTKEKEAVDLSDRGTQNERIRKGLLTEHLKRSGAYLPRPLCNLDVTVCNILNSKGLGADIVFIVGFDQGRLPSSADVSESEVYQVLVAITRAKKRLYLVNTVGKAVSHFKDCLDADDLEIHEIGD